MESEGDTMSRDDYFVLVYQILAYLYTCLKEGQQVDPKYLKPDSPLLGVNEQYWTYIMVNILKQGYIEGITVTKAWGKQSIISELEACMITPEGIEYLCDNSFMQKARQLLKDVGAIAPFIFH